MSIVGIYHTYSGEVHKGTSADCRVCKRLKKTAPKAFSAAMGKLGGKKSAQGKHRHCKCGKQISKENKTGKCLKCYQQWASAKYKLPKLEVTSKTCKACTRRLDYRNKSGYCREHFNEAEKLRTAG